MGCVKEYERTEEDGRDCCCGLVKNGVDELKDGLFNPDLFGVIH